MYQNLNFPLFFRSHFLALMVPEKSKNPRNPNNAKGRRQRKELPCYNLKEYAFAGVLRESCELGLAEVWEHSSGPRSSTSFGNGVPCNTLLGALTLGSPSPRTQHHSFQAAFQLVTKTKDALYVQTASAKKNKLRDAFFFQALAVKPTQILTITTLDPNSCEIIKEGDTVTLGLKSCV